MTKYADPEDIVEKMILIKKSPTLGDVKNLMDKIFPNLFITVLQEYSSDYSHLTENWKNLCKSINTEPKQIIILDNYSEEDTLVKTFCELFTTAGFSVRRKCEYIPCNVCHNKAIPSEMIHKDFKDRDFNVPETWSESCTACK